MVGKNWGYGAPHNRTAPAAIADATRTIKPATSDNGRIEGQLPDSQLPARKSAAAARVPGP
jgi:hypothetical protein